MVIRRKTWLFASIQGHYHYLLDYILLHMNFSNIVIRGIQSWILYQTTTDSTTTELQDITKFNNFYLFLPCISFLCTAFTLRILITFPVIDVYAHDSFFSSNPSYEYYIFSESVFLCKREYNTFIYKTCWFLQGKKYHCNAPYMIVKSFLNHTKWH